MSFTNLTHASVRAAPVDPLPLPLTRPLPVAKAIRARLSDPPEAMCAAYAHTLACELLGEHGADDAVLTGLRLCGELDEHGRSDGWRMRFVLPKLMSHATVQVRLDAQDGEITARLEPATAPPLIAQPDRRRWWRQHLTSEMRGLPAPFTNSTEVAAQLAADRVPIGPDLELEVGWQDQTPVWRVSRGVHEQRSFAFC